MPTLRRVRTQMVQQAGNELLNTFYFAADLTTADAAASAVGAFFAALQPCMSEDLHYSSVAEQELIDDATGHLTGVEVSGVSYADTGTLTGQPLPFATQALIKWHTGAIVAGRRLAGRTFIPGMTENLNDAGVPNADLLTTLNAAIAVLANGDPDSAVVWSRKHHVSAVMSSGTPWTEYAVLRSRRD